MQNSICVAVPSVPWIRTPNLGKIHCRGRRRFSTVNCCRSTKFSKMRSRRLRKSRRSNPNESQSTLSIVRFIQECWHRVRCYVIDFGVDQSFGEAQGQKRLEL